MLPIAPRSVLGLLLLGFAFVVLPLAAALLQAVWRVDDLVSQSEDLVWGGTRLTRESQRLREQVVALERSGRQYQVLRDPELLELYDQRQRRLTATLETLASLDPDGRLAASLGQIEEERRQLYHTLHSASPQTETVKAPHWDRVATVREGFARLSALAAGASVEVDHLIDARLETLRIQTRETRRALFWLSAVVVPFALVFSAIFTTLTARPIGRLARAIRSLGQGRLDAPVQVSGPRELRDLGDDLDWLRRRLAALESHKTRFLQRLSHELKTPLASIREGAQMLMEGVVGPLTDRQVEVVEILRDSARELHRLIDDLLRFSGTRDYDASLNPRELSSRELVRTVLDRHRLEIERKRISVRSSGADLRLRADSEKLATALDNLLTNALKFSPPGGRIEILARRTEAEVIIEVRDEGPGVDTHERERIFQPFYRGRGTRGRDAGGSGIGLSVARECVEVHGGCLELVPSASPGARFRLALPARCQA